VHSILFSVRLFVVTKRVLPAKTWLEHCILAEVGVCYRGRGSQIWGGMGKPPVNKTQKVTAAAGQPATADFTF
jgi:hypothetical protein